MRHLEGNDAGEIGSRQYYGTVEPDANNEKPKLSVDILQQAIDRETDGLPRNILSVYQKYQWKSSSPNRTWTKI